MARTSPDSGTLRLSAPAVLLLASLAVPRVVVHDLGLSTSTAVNALLVVGPPIIWLVVVLRAGLGNPFSTLLTIGLVYGLLLAAGHQLMWGAAFGPSGPALDGNLEGTMSPWVESLVLRGFAAVSSVFTGLLVGAVTGLVGWAADAARRVGVRRT